jgi:hypothetical protein
LAILLFISSSLLSLSCVSREIRVPVFITPIEEATLEQLIEKINQFESIRTFTARCDLQFQSQKNAELGLGRQYRTAEGLLVLARPGNIRLMIQVPVVKTKVAEMASDGKRFQVIVYPEEHRAFLQGSNDRTYEVKQTNMAQDPRRRQQAPFAKIRPQHFTTGLLIDPVRPNDAETRVVLEEYQQIEDDVRPNAPRDGHIIRSYYFVSVIKLGSANRAQLTRKYWFDRTKELHMVREQVYEGEGRLVEEVSYDRFVTHPQFDGFLPTRVLISRPSDSYSVTIDFNRDSVKLNGEVLAQAFTLQKPEEWGDSVQTTDLDKTGHRQ